MSMQVFLFLFVQQLVVVGPRKLPIKGGRYVVIISLYVSKHAHDCLVMFVSVSLVEYVSEI